MCSDFSCCLSIAQATCNCEETTKDAKKCLKNVDEITETKEEQLDCQSELGELRCRTSKILWNDLLRDLLRDEATGVLDNMKSELEVWNKLFF